MFRAVLPLLEVFGQKVFWVGPAPGQGQLAKLLNNLLSATALAITSEALAFGVSAGLDARTLLEIFNASSGRNTATSDKFPQQVLTRKFGAGFRLKLMAKDVELCLAEARSRHIPLVVGSVVQQLWTLAARQAAVEDDMTVIVRTFEDWTGVTVKWAEVNGQWSVLILRDGAAVALATIDASAQGINRILWIMRPSKLAAISRSGQKVGERFPPEPAIS